MPSHRHLFGYYANKQISPTSNTKIDHTKLLSTVSTQISTDRRNHIAITQQRGTPKWQSRDASHVIMMRRLIATKQL